MSPVFRHGGLRLYLLKLLDEEPRHGYDVIRLLQDRFLGVYSPSPGTIYPRLARLEDEGLVTHEVIDGKKIYKITDAGRAELHRRLDDLADLEDQLTASVRDIASQISRDVRETVRSLRDELTWAVREASRGAPAGAGAGGASKGAAAGAGAGDAGAGGAAAGAGAGGATTTADKEPGGGEGEAHSGQDERSWPGEHADWREWADWACRGNWRQWAGLHGRGDWREWFGWEAGSGRAEWDRLREQKEQAKASWRDAKQQARSEWQEATRQAKADWRDSKRQAKAGWHVPDQEFIADLERLAGAFAGHVRGVAAHAEAVSEDAAASLAKILGDALNRITKEVFRVPDEPEEPQEPSEPGEPAGSGSEDRAPDA